MRKGYITFEAAVYAAVAAILVFVVYGQVNKLLIPLKHVRLCAQSEAIIMAVLGQIVRDLSELEQGELVSATPATCIWNRQDGQAGWLFENRALYYCRGSFDKGQRAWKRVRKQAILTSVTGQFSTMSRQNLTSIYSIAISCNNRKYEQSCSARNGVVA